MGNGAGAPLPSANSVFSLRRGGLPSVPLSQLSSGDVLLLRQPGASSDFGSLDGNVLRAMAAAQRGALFSAQEQRVPEWSHCALLAVHKSKPYILFPTLEGVEVYPAGKQLRRWLEEEGLLVVVRQLRGADGERAAQLCRELLLGALQGCSWKRYLPDMVAATDGGGSGSGGGMRTHQVMRLPRAAGAASTGPPRRDSGDGEALASAARLLLSPLGSPLPPAAARAASSGSAETTSVRSDDGRGCGAASPAPRAAAPASCSSSSVASDLPSALRPFVRLLIPRVWGALAAVAPLVERELRRAFAAADRDDDGFVRAADVHGILQDARGRLVSAAEAEALLGLMGLGGSGSASVSGAEAGGEAGITLGRILAVLARRPLQEVPVEHDLHAILCGEFVATAYEQLGLLAPRAAYALPPAAAALVARTTTSGSSPARTLTASDEATAGGTGAGGSSRRASVVSVSEEPVAGALSSGSGSAGGASGFPIGGVAAAPQPLRALRAGGGVPPRELPPSPLSMRGPATSSLSGAAMHAPRDARTVVVIDGARDAMRHFLPSSFASSQRSPPLALLRGRLDPEALVALPPPAEGDSRASPHGRGGLSGHASESEAAEAVQALTAQLFSGAIDARAEHGGSGGLAHAAGASAHMPGAALRASGPAGAIAPLVASDSAQFSPLRPPLDPALASVPHRASVRLAWGEGDGEP